jgi:cell wall-associated NlpC family hydrolase
LPFVLGASSALPAARPLAPAPAARFAVAGLLGATGDAGGAASAPEPNNSTAQGDTVGGTLNFGDPILPPKLILRPTPPLTPTDSTDPPATAPTPAPAEGGVENPPAPEPIPLDPAPPPPAPAPPDETTDPGASRGLLVASIARQYVGYPYRYGAAGPRAFDCSGLTLFVYRQFGINLPHKANAQYSQRYGQRIAAMDDLKAGDLVFFRNTSGRGITHTAIYIGGGVMVSANTPRQGVQYTSISGAYWRRHWAGGLRPHP